jgi:predicted ester cyclase
VTNSGKGNTVNASEHVVANKTAVWRIVEEGFNAGDDTITEELCDATCVNPSSIIAVPQGPRSIGVHIKNAQASMQPGGGLRIVDAVGSGDDVALTWRTDGHGDGSKYLGLDETSTDETSAWVIGFWRFNPDGKLVRWDAAWEPMRLLAQHGYFDAAARTAEERADEETYKVANVGRIGDLTVPRSRHFPHLPSREELLEYRAPAPGRGAQLLEMLTALLEAEFAGKAGVSGDLLTDSCPCSYSDYQHGTGPTGFDARATDFARAFSGAEVTIERLVVEQDRCAAAWTVSASHTGDFLGLEPSGRTIHVSGAVTVRLDGDRIAQWIEVLDILSLLRQLAGLGALMPGAYQSFSF